MKTYEIPSSEKAGATHLVVTMRCCRDWPIVVGTYLKRRCGLCGEIPEWPR